MLYYLVQAARICIILRATCYIEMLMLSCLVQAPLMCSIRHATSNIEMLMLYCLVMLLACVTSVVQHDTLKCSDSIALFGLRVCVGSLCAYDKDNSAVYLLVLVLRAKFCQLAFFLSIHGL